MKIPKIRKIVARQILDSRGNPTVEANVILVSGQIGQASVPSGISTGSGEALELRDLDSKFYRGKSVQKAVWNVNHTINDVLAGNIADQTTVDNLMLDLDGISNKSHLGANAILAVSLATAKAVANANHLPFYKYIAKLADTENEMSLPMPMFNVVNGGAHASWVTDIQEYSIIPHGARTFLDAIKMSAETFYALRDILSASGFVLTVGDEGGYVPRIIQNNLVPLKYIEVAIAKAGYRTERDISIAIDVAASELSQGPYYVSKTHSTKKTAHEMIDWYTGLIHQHPIISIEDGLGEHDWSGWEQLTERLGDKIQIIGDDLFVTNTKLLQKGIDRKIANAILIKPNQIGTLTETIATVLLAQKHNYRTIISHRSGDTEDTSIAHIAVGLGAGQIKAGSLSRSEHLCKYNELIRIAETNPALELSRPF